MISGAVAHAGLTREQLWAAKHTVPLLASTGGTNYAEKGHYDRPNYSNGS